jgi:hypothetical protein
MSKLTKFSIFIAVATTTYVTGTLAVTLWADSKPYTSVTTMASLKISEPRWPTATKLGAQFGRFLAKWEEEQNRKRRNVYINDPQRRERYGNVKDIIDQAEKEEK